MTFIHSTHFSVLSEMYCGSAQKHPLSSQRDDHAADDRPVAHRRWSLVRDAAAGDELRYAQSSLPARTDEMYAENASSEERRPVGVIIITIS